MRDWVSKMWQMSWRETKQQLIYQLPWIYLAAAYFLYISITNYGLLLGTAIISPRQGKRQDR